MIWFWIVARFAAARGDDPVVQDAFVLGWEEWLALPELGLPAIKAKVDTGARTSSLHAFSIEEFGAVGRMRVRFGMHPIPGRDDVTVFCTADVVDHTERPLIAIRADRVIVEGDSRNAPLAQALHHHGS